MAQAGRLRQMNVAAAQAGRLRQIKISARQIRFFAKLCFLA